MLFILVYFWGGVRFFGFGVGGVCLFVVPIWLVFLGLIIRTSLVMFLNIPNLHFSSPFLWFHRPSHFALKVCCIKHKLYFSPQCLLALCLCYYTLSFFNLISLFLPQSWDRESSIFHDHHEAKTRTTKKILEDETSVDSASTQTLENLIHARRCGNKDKCITQISSYSITIINIFERDLELKINPSQITSLHCLHCFLRTVFFPQTKITYSVFPIWNHSLI